MDAIILPRTYANEQVTTLVKKLKRDENTDIEEIIVGQHEDDRAIRAVKMGLPSKEKTEHVSPRLPLHGGTLRDGSRLCHMQGSKKEPCDISDEQ